MISKLHRNLDAINYVSGATLSIDLPREFIMTGLNLEMEGSLAITGALTLRDEVPQRFVRQLELVADGVTIQTWTGELLCAYNYFMEGRYLAREIPGTAINDPENFRLHWFFPFQMENVLTPGYTYFDPTLYRSVQLKISWGTTADLFSAGAATVNSATLRVTTTELRASASQISTNTGRFSLFQTSRILETISAANTSKRINLPRDYDVWALMLRISDAATGYALSDTLLNNVIVQERGVSNLVDLTYKMAQNIQQFKQGLTANFQTPTLDGSMVEGYLFLNFLERGISDRIQPQSYNQFDLIVDVDAATRLDIVPLMLSV